MKLNCHDRFDKVQYLTKTIQDNDVIDPIGVVYGEIRIEGCEPFILSY